MITLAPHDASLRAIAYAMPDFLPEPVTTAILSFRSSVMFLFLNDGFKKLATPAYGIFQRAVIATESIVIFVAD
jgi:hypothetical protein